MYQITNNVSPMYRETGRLTDMEIGRCLGVWSVSGLGTGTRPGLRARTSWFPDILCFNLTLIRHESRPDSFWNTGCKAAMRSPVGLSLLAPFSKPMQLQKVGTYYSDNVGLNEYSILDLGQKRDERIKYWFVRGKLLAA